MIAKLLRWLSSPRQSPIMRDNRYEHEDDAWHELQRRGYAVLEHANGLWYCFTDNKVLASDWYVKKSYEARVRHIREWSKKELARVLELESEE